MNLDFLLACPFCLERVRLLGLNNLTLFNAREMFDVGNIAKQEGHLYYHTNSGRIALCSAALLPEHSTVGDPAHDIGVVTDHGPGAGGAPQDAPGRTGHHGAEGGPASPRSARDGANPGGQDAPGAFARGT